MRIPQQTISRNLADILRGTQTDLARKQIQISSGKKNMARSDDPIETAAAADLKDDMAARDRWRENVEYGTYWNQITGGKLDIVNDVVQNIQSKVILARNGTHPPEYQRDIAREVNNALEDLFALANSTSDGVPMFAGTATGQSPFEATRDADGNITAVTYQGNGSSRQVQVDEQAQLEVGLPGGGADGFFMATAAGIDLFDSLVTLRDELAGGDQPSSTSMDQINAVADHVIQKLVGNGVKQGRMEDLAARFTTDDVNAQSRLSDLEDVDVAEAAMELGELQASYEASLQIASRINRLSLMDYI